MINLFQKNVGKIIPYGIIVILLILLFFKGCGPAPSTATITTPEIKGSFEAKKPQHVEITPETKYIQIPGKTVMVKDTAAQAKLAALQAENERLKAAFAKPESNKDSLYNSAIALNSFSADFDDEYLSLNVSGIVRGEVQEITPSYRIKPRKLDVPIKQTVFRLLAGAEIGNTLQLDKLALRGNLMFQNRKGNVLSASYDTDERVWIGYNFSVFDIKR